MSNQVTPTTSAAADRLLRLPQVEALTGLKRSSLYKKIQNREFPAQLKLSARASAWSENAVQGWIQDQIRSAASGAVK